MFTDKIEPIISNWVATIGGVTKEVGTVSWSCNDDEGKFHTDKLNHIL